MQQVIWLSAIACRDQEEVGSKAARLATLLAHGLPVPAGFCVTSTAYQEHVFPPTRIKKMHRLIAQGKFADVRKHIERIALSETLISGLATAYGQLTEHQAVPVAVRSSSTAEDLTQHSFAGLYETVLHVADQASVVEAVRRCWSSFWSEEAVFYRSTIGMENTCHGMAVLIQAMVQSKQAGVLFTRDPLDSGKNLVVVEFVLGSGESLVGGEVGANRLWIDRTTRRPLQASCLDGQIDPSLLEELVDLALDIERSMGCPQDVEWCIDTDNRLWLLQTRPMTGFAAPPDLPHAATSGWERVYDEPFSPLGCDLALRRYDVWVRAINACYKTAFKPKIKSVNGFLYYDATWRTPSRYLHLWMSFWKFIHWLNAYKLHDRYVKLIAPRYENQLFQLRRQAIAELDTPILLETFNTVIRLYLALQFESYPVVEACKTSLNLLDWICRLCFVKDDGLQSSNLLSGLENYTVARDLELYRLSKILTEVLSADEMKHLDYRLLAEFKTSGGAKRKLWEEVESFLDKYGYVWADRYPRDPACEIDREALVSFMVHVAQAPDNHDLSDQHMQQTQGRTEAVSLAARRLSTPTWFPVRWYLFRGALRRAEQLFPHKENRNHDVYDIVMLIRKYGLEIGQRLQAEQLLQSEADIFFLHWDEIQAAVTHKEISPELRVQIERRKQNYQSSRALTLAPSAPPLPFPARLMDGDSAENFLLTGEPCSPGVAAGPACVVRVFDELKRVNPGDIVVCSHMRPAWSPVLAKARGLVVETGGLLSHGATLAREYGVPTVMNVPGLTSYVSQGDRLIVDGHLGTVLVEKRVSELESR